MDSFTFLIQESSIQLSPQRHLLHNLTDTLLFLFGLGFPLGFVIVIFLSLLLLQLLESASHLLSEAKLDGGFTVGVAEC